MRPDWFWERETNYPNGPTADALAEADEDEGGCAEVWWQGTIGHDGEGEGLDLASPWAYAKTVLYR